MKYLQLLFALIFPVIGVAENYPYRSDVLWVTVPDHADWIYKTGQDAVIDIQLYKYGVPVDNVEIQYAVGPELLIPESKGTVTMKKGHASINIGTMRDPGFRDCQLEATIDGKTYKHHVKVGYSPEKIKPIVKKPSDFDEFWARNLKELEALPLTYTMTPAPQYTTDRFEAWLVKLQVTKQKQSIYGYLFIPKEIPAGGCPIVICPPGAGIKTIKEPLRHRYYADNGCIRFEMEIHGLNPEMTQEEFDEISRAFGGRENGYLTNGLDNRDNYYMKRVYLALVRAVDFLTTLPQWDGKNVVMQGGSQGGALAIVGASLDPRVTLCVANHPALSDMSGTNTSRADGYPHFTKMQGMDTDAKNQCMAYYDVVNFARNLKVPIRMTWGYNDNTCPPTTSYAVWNVIASSKDALITPINEHWTSEDTEHGHLEWILDHLK